MPRHPNRVQSPFKDPRQHSTGTTACATPDSCGLHPADQEPSAITLPRETAPGRHPLKTGEAGLAVHPARSRSSDRSAGRIGPARGPTPRSTTFWRPGERANETGRSSGVLGPTRIEGLDAGHGGTTHRQPPDAVLLDDPQCAVNLSSPANCSGRSSASMAGPRPSRGSLARMESRPVLYRRETLTRTPRRGTVPGGG